MMEALTASALSPAARLRDAFSMLRRHGLLAAVVALLVGCAGTVVIFRMPDVYQAETRILVNPQRVSEKFVSSAVPLDSNERLNTLSQQVLSSTRLQAIVDQLHLYPELHAKAGREQLLDVMRHHITIDLKQSSDGPSSFTITFTGSSAVQVSAVTNRLAASFIDWNLQDRAQQAERTTDFLTKELTDTKTQLDQLEEQLRIYKLQHLGELPDQQPANLQTLSRLQVELQANVDAENRIDHESFLANANAQTEAAPFGSPDTPLALQTTREQLESHLTTARRDLAELRERYTPTFPDVVTKEAEVRSLEKQLAHMPETPATALPASASSQDPRLQLLARDRTRLANERRAIDGQISAYQARVNAEPIREQELSSLSRDYDTARDHYRSLLEKSYSASMATELERRQEGGSFTLLDPARVPDAPIGPNRPALLSGCFLLALLAGAGAAIVREILDGSIKSEAELRSLLPGVPLLGVTPLRQELTRVRVNWSRP